MKPYFLHIDATDYMLYALYNVGFMLLFGIFFRVAGPRDVSSQVLSVLIFQLYFVVLMLDSVLDFMPFMPDTELFSHLITTNILPPDMPAGVTSFYYLSFVIHFLFLGSPVLFVVSQIFLYIISLHLYARAWRLYTGIGNSQPHRVVFLLLCLFLPSGLLYVTAPLRDTFIIFGFALFHNGMVWFIRRSLNWNLLWGNIMLFFFRPQLLFYAVLAFALKPLEQGRYRWLKLGGMILIAVVGVFGVSSLLKYQLTPQWLSKVRTIRIGNIEGEGDTYGYVQWNSFADVFADVPLLSLQFLLSPLPIVADVNPIDKFTIFVDSLVVLALLVVLVMFLRTVFKRYPAWVMMILVYVLLLGTYEYHLTGAVRHRFPVVLMLACLVAQLIADQIHKLKRSEPQP